jgi:hypothetical protein
MCPPHRCADFDPDRNTARSAHSNGIASAYDSGPDVADQPPSAYFPAYSNARAYIDSYSDPDASSQA